MGDTVTAYLRAGAGRPVVLLRTVDGPDPLWGALMSGLTSHFRVIVPTAPPAHVEFGPWLRAFLDGLGLLQVGVVAEAAVAVCVLGFAMADPDRVSHLVLISSDGNGSANVDGALADPSRSAGLPLLVVHPDSPGDDAAHTVRRFLGA